MPNHFHDIFYVSDDCDKTINQLLANGKRFIAYNIIAAQNTPTIALFGPGVHGVFYPKNEKSIVHHYFLGQGHKQQTLENSTIFSISVDEVKESVDRMLG